MSSFRRHVIVCIERGHWEGRKVGVSLVLKWTPEKYDEMVCTGFSWFRIDMGEWLL
jgi:hypothetical protein